MAQTTAGLVVKKKKWITILAPKVFNEMPLGETRVVEPQDAIGRNVSISAMTITGDPQRQSVNVALVVKSAEGDNVMTEVVGYAITPSAVRKIIRRGKEKIEESFEVKTADGLKLRIKPLLITRGRAKRSILKSLRKNMRETVLKETAKARFEELVKELIAHKFQKMLSDSLRKIYPLSVCEIRHVSIVRERKAGEKSVEHKS